MDESNTMVGTTYLLTQVRRIDQSVQQLTSHLDLAETLHKERIDTLNTSIANVAGLGDLNSQAITKESVERINADLMLDGRISALSTTQADDKAYLLGQIEEHHAEIDARTTALEAGIESLDQSISASEARLVGEFQRDLVSLGEDYNFLENRVNVHDGALDTITLDSDEFSWDTDEPVFQWSLLAAAQEWHVELANALNVSEKAIKETIAKYQSIAEQSAANASQALENTSVSKLIETLQGQVGSSVLDSILSGRIDAMESDIDRERRERAASIKAEVESLAAKMREDALIVHERLLKETSERVDSHAIEAQRLADRVQLEAELRTAALSAVASDFSGRIAETAAQSSAEVKAKAKEIIDAANQAIDSVRTQFDQSVLDLSDGITSEVEHLKTADSEIINSLDSFKITTNTGMVAVQDRINMVANEHSTSVEKIEGLTASFSGLEGVVDKAKADIIVTTKAIADADKALTQKIETLSSDFGDAKGRIDTLSETVATNESVNAKKVETITADLNGLGTHVADVERIAESAVTATEAQTREITNMKASISTLNNGILSKADADALHSLQTKVDGNELAMAERIDELAASLTDLGEGAETNVDVTAFNVLKAEVTNTQGVVKGHTSDLNTLNGTINNLKTGINANTSAVSGLETIVTEQGDDIDLQARSLEELRNTLDATKNDLKLKATTEALNFTNSEVKLVDGKVTAVSESLKTHSSRLDSVEGLAASKADAEALENVYTKSEADDRATTIAAGKVEQFKAGLTIGGTNLARDSRFNVMPTQWVIEATGATHHVMSGGTLPNFVDGVSTAYVFKAVAEGQGIRQAMHLGLGKEITISFWSFAFVTAAKVTVHGAGLKDTFECNGIGKWQKSVFTTTTTLATPELTFTYTPGAEVWLSSVKVEYGNVATHWSPSPLDVDTALDANAQAIRTVDASVDRVGGDLAIQTTRVDGISGRLDDVNAEAGKAIENAAKAQQTANTAVTRVDATATQVTDLSSALTSRLVENLWGTSRLKWVNETGTNTPTLLGSGDTFSFKSEVVTFAGGTSSVYYDYLWDDVTKPLVAGASYNVTMDIRASRNAPLNILYIRAGHYDGSEYRWGHPVKTDWVTHTFKVTPQTSGVGSIDHIFGYRLMASDGWVAGDWIEFRDIRMVSADAQPVDVQQVKASLVQDYYTKVDADKAISSGVDKFKSSIVIGGTNLVTNTMKNFRVGDAGNAAMLRSITPDGSLMIKANGTLATTYLANWVGANSLTGGVRAALKVGDDFTTTLWFKAVDISKLPTETVRFYHDGTMSYANLVGDLSALSSGKEVPFHLTRKWAAGAVDIYPHLNVGSTSLGGGLILTKWKIERGMFSTDWADSSEEAHRQLNATATAIRSMYTKAEANKVIADATTTVKAELDGTLAGYDQTIKSWVDRNKAEAVMVEALAAELVPHMAGNTDLFADMNVSVGYQGVITALADSDASLMSRMEKMDGEFLGAKSSISKVQQLVNDYKESTAAELTVIESSFGNRLTESINDAVKGVEDRVASKYVTSAKITTDYITKSDANSAIASAKTQVQSEVRVQFETALEDAKEYTTGTIDLMGLNPDLYYPVAFSLPKMRNYIQIACKLYEYQDNVPWATHGTKTFSMNLEWEVGPSGWGAQSVSRIIGDFNHLWAGQSPVLGPAQISESSAEYVYLRGGARYGYRSTKGAGATAYHGDWNTGHGIVKPISYTESLLPVPNAEKLRTRIEEQKESIDGVRGVRSVSIDNNGVMSGYGLVSEMVGGNTVVSAFGVNADQFYVGSPANGKKVFSVNNGVTVINDAIVGNLSANKITTGQMHGDRITAGTLHANRLVAGSVTADKMSVSSLSAISANLGTITTLRDASRPYGTRMIIQGGVLTVYDDNNVMRARFGFW